MILIEGPDMVGKTTLAKELAVELDTHVYQHLSKPPASFHPTIGYIDLASRYSVRDRFHISQAVYARVTGRDTSFTPEANLLVGAHLRMLGVFTVILTCDDCQLEKRFAKLEDRELYDLETILKANNTFKEIGRKNGRHMDFNFDVDLHINCSEKNPYPTHNTVDYILNLYEDRQSLLEQF